MTKNQLHDRDLCLGLFLEQRILGFHKMSMFYCPLLSPLRNQSRPIPKTKNYQNSFNSLQLSFYDNVVLLFTMLQAHSPFWHIQKRPVIDSRVSNLDKWFLDYEDSLKRKQTIKPNDWYTNNSLKPEDFQFEKIRS